MTALAYRDTVPLDSQKLVYQIESLNVKLEWLAIRIRVDRKTVYRWVHGKVKTIRRHNLSSLAEALECSPDYLRLSTKEEEEREMAQNLAIITRLFNSGEFQLANSLITFLLGQNISITSRAMLLKRLSECEAQMGSLEKKGS